MQNVSPPSGRRRLALGVLVAAQLTILGLLWANGIITPDFFPLHLGAVLLARGESPYGPAATALLVQLWDAPEPFPRAGIAYPLPALLPVLPLAPAPFPAAALLWGALSVGLVIGVARRQAPAGLALALIFWPTFWSLAIGQATLLWTGLILALLLLLGAIGAGPATPSTHAPQGQLRPALLGLCLVLLPLKPQTGLLFGLAGAWLAWRGERRAWAWALGWAALLAGASWLIAPTWLGDWLGQLQVYRDAVRPISLWPWGAALLAAGWRLPWWSRLAIVQVFLFPLVRQEYGIDPYTMMPLLLVWLGIGGRLALVGAALSWIWPALVVAGMGGVAAELTLFLPLLIAGAWRTLRPARDEPPP